MRTKSLWKNTSCSNRFIFVCLNLFLARQAPFARRLSWAILVRGAFGNQCRSSFRTTATQQRRPIPRINLFTLPPSGLRVGDGFLHRWPEQYPRCSGHHGRSRGPYIRRGDHERLVCARHSSLGVRSFGAIYSKEFLHFDFSMGTCVDILLPSPCYLALLINPHIRPHILTDRR